MPRPRFLPPVIASHLFAGLIRNLEAFEKDRHVIPEIIEACVVIATLAKVAGLTGNSALILRQ
jgi:hypothetical protein